MTIARSWMMLAAAAAIVAGSEPVPAAEGAATSPKPEAASREAPAADPAAELPETAKGKPSPPPSDADAPYIHEGTLRDPRYGMQFPVPEGWALVEPGSAEVLDFANSSCEGCQLKVLISPGNDLGLEETVRELKRSILATPEAVILSEESTKIARERAYTLVKEELVKQADAKNDPPPGAPDDAAPKAIRMLTRYATFNHAGDKYYLLLRAPRDRFVAEEGGFERLLAKLRFKP